ncbi:MAG: GntR family transcriptional regulator [Deltaproteobacteria bacterium]|nr:GntR family transcriptional regulator [Deltaproteobacteria bacterium]
MNERERAYSSIREAITCGQLSPGEKLAELSLCDTFGVGRTPLREAFRQLQMEGYIEVIPNRGAFVRKLSVDELCWIYETLSVLEAHAAERLAGECDDSALQSLSTLNQQLVLARKAMEYPKWFSYNYSFHDLIRTSCGNPILADQIAQLRNRTYRNRGLLLSLHGTIDTYQAGHDEILKAIASRNPSKAASAMRQHLNQARENLRSFLISHPFPP